MLHCVRGERSVLLLPPLPQVLAALEVGRGMADVHADTAGTSSGSGDGRHGNATSVAGGQGVWTSAAGAAGWSQTRAAGKAEDTTHAAFDVISGDDGPAGGMGESASWVGPGPELQQAVELFGVRAHLGEGDALFIPAFWLHAVWSEPAPPRQGSQAGGSCVSIAVNQWFYHTLTAREAQAAAAAHYVHGL